MAEYDDVLAVLLFFMVVFASLLVINSTGNITGMAVAETQENVQLKVEALANKLDFLSDVNDMNLCLAVKMDTVTTYSYEVKKLGSVIDVKQLDICKGDEDLVLSYISYAKFLEHAQGNPTFNDFKLTGDGKSFYVLPSKYIAFGMSIKNQAEFESKYGILFNKYFSASERTQFLTSPEQREAAAMGFPGVLIYTGIGLVVAVLLFVLLLPKLMKKPTVTEDLELIAYIKSAISEGHEESEIKQSLLQSGWKEEAINKALNAVNQQQSQETPAEAL